MKYKRITAVILTVSVALLTAGCSGGSHIITQNQHTSRSDTSAASKPYAVNESLTKDKITLTVWESKDGPDEFIRKAGDSFHELYPNITVEYVNVENTDSTKELLKKESTVKKPDVFAAPSDMIGELAANKLINPTDDSQFVNTTALTLAREAVIYNDIMYGYPVSCETYALFYNKKFVSENDIPQTWEDMITWSKGFGSLYSGKYGFIFHANTAYYLAMLMSSGGNKLMDGDRYGLTNASSKYGLELLSQMKDIFPSDITNYSYDDYDDLFLNGNAAFAVNGPWFVSKADAAGLDYGIVKLPSFKNGSNTYSLAAVRVMFVYSQSEHSDEADEFARYLLSDDMQKMRTEITETLPATDIYINDKLNGFVDQLEMSYIVPNTTKMAKFWTYGENVCKDIFGGVDPATELRNYVNYIDGTDKQEADNSSTDSNTSAEQPDSTDSTDSD